VESILSAALLQLNNNKTEVSDKRIKFFIINICFECNQSFKLFFSKINKSYDSGLFFY
tara:strand:- start:578 stop:751 length:174 start_codon:yes stop_codon:yes gene_type:complete